VYTGTGSRCLRAMNSGSSLNSARFFTSARNSASPLARRAVRSASDSPYTCDSRIRFCISLQWHGQWVRGWMGAPRLSWYISYRKR
jgi:hypothetical protein